MIISHPGAPGLASETSQAEDAGCPTLAAFLFLRLGWDATNTTLLSPGKAAS